MNIKTRVLSIAGAAIIALGTITGVSAGETTKTDVTVQVSAPKDGALSWSIAGTTEFTAVTGSLDNAGTSQGGLLLTVKDTRFTRVGWSLSIGATDFTGTKTKATIDVGNFSVTPGKLDVVGDTDVVPAQGSVMLDDEVPQVLISAAKGSGSGRYELPLAGTVTIPANTMPDTYVSTITVDETSAP